ncbi:chemotaxis response regulator protein-glutamate methylesterase [Halorhodospira abdelmalekii]|uniref:protein-glutamate methylesterase/protein-glutamine glutaminase n=1 Tax=Halorhodospira abdelmalekii TaxID=421629 RepID=UPI0019065E51|nr:chemotaxis response regulator protein-glutamate methylesterase [Halorhodospira abdelmalekii]MBK1735689.1 chemotaxis response regulator protein-glutamate methylesterase [Halorhodospira abdelmalekii]
MSIRVLVVDDSGFFRRRIRAMVESHPQLHVCGEAANGREAITLTERLCPDVITMDIEMPELDGISAVRQIMRRRPTPVLMFSSLTYDGAKATLEALEAGASDFIPKRFADISGDMAQVQRQFCERLVELGGGARGGGRRQGEAAAAAAAGSSPHESSHEDEHSSPRRAVPPSSERARGGERGAQRSPHGAAAAPGGGAAGRGGARAAGSSVTDPSVDRGAAAQRSGAVLPEAGRRAAHVSTRTGARAAPRVADLEVVVIGCSTGGPVALQRVLTVLPASFPLPILVVQHMPASFTPAFAERLNELCQVRVREAQDGDLLVPGEVLIAPGGRHIGVRGRGGALSVYSYEGPSEHHYKPSVDIAFSEVARAAPGRVLGVVLTGMGADGAKGARVLKEGGSWVWSQDEASSVIYGMPAAVAKAGLSDQVLALDQVGRELARLR